MVALVLARTAEACGIAGMVALSWISQRDLHIGASYLFFFGQASAILRSGGLRRMLLRTPAGDHNGGWAKSLRAADPVVLTRRARHCGDCASRIVYPGSGDAKNGVAPRPPRPAANSGWARNARGPPDRPAPALRLRDSLAAFGGPGAGRQAAVKSAPGIVGLGADPARVAGSSPGPAEWPISLTAVRVRLAPSRSPRRGHV